MEFVTYEQTGHIAVMTINRPKALNALNKQVLTEINEVLDQVDVNTVRCMIVTGAGEKSFVAGADIGEMSVLNREEGVAWGKYGNDIFRKLETLPIPTIAAVNGFALGGGCRDFHELRYPYLFRECSIRTAGGWPGHHTGIWRNPETRPVSLAWDAQRRSSTPHPTSKLMRHTGSVW